MRNPLESSKVTKAPASRVLLDGNRHEPILLFDFPFCDLCFPFLFFGL